MSLEEFDIWDTNFLEDAIRAEEEVIAKSSRNPTQFQYQYQYHHHNPQPPLLPPPQPPPSSSTSWMISTNNINSFSPPRELSQKPLIKPTNQISVNILDEEEEEEEEEVEIDKLKRELGRVSQQLSHLEQECTELKKDRDQKEEQLKYVMTQITAKDDGNHRYGHVKYEAANQDHPQYLLSEAKDIHRTSWAKGGTSEKLSCNNRSVLERVLDPSSNHQACENYGLVRKNNIQNGVSVPSDSRHCILIDDVPTTSNEFSTKRTTLPETTAQPKCTNAIGVQTDTSDYHSTIDKGLFPQQALSNELLAIWGSPSTQRSGKDLVSKLLVTCATDFYVLFRCMSLSIPSKITLDSLSEESLYDVALHERAHSVQSVEAAKVSRLYLMLTKINNGIVQLGTFFEALLELCSLQNVVVVHRSLRIVRALLQHMLSLDSRFGSRDNVMVEGICPKDYNVESCESGRVSTGIQFGMTRMQTSFLSGGASDIRSFDMDALCNKEHGHPGYAASSFSPDWGSLVQMMNQIAMGNIEGPIQVEAISIINLILMRSNPCLEREKFGQKLLFESVPRLLQKEVGMPVLKQAVRLLFLLLNCPKLLMMFSSSFKDDRKNVGAAADGNKDASAYGGLSSILKGLADCVQCKENGIEALRLRRHAIIVLAFVASSGKSGFEVLLNPEISKRINFLELIMQALAMEMDAEAAELDEPSEICRERISLIREALILLNRLASSPVYSASVLGILTSSRDMASLTIDVANRMCRKGRPNSIPAMSTKMKMEAEIIDLARVFKSRVYSYLGDTIS
ncbi:hypothetical protein BVC80_9095g26 [Macleaya cordata]|uniref:Uncharacterized protein n=1 Tax=Macleaya cordata TaxID=56857 RepID=A0A200PXE7_MACCD|nr:hypothetical protein BVC80_9095g26 [Macleaya cordata]